MSSFQVALDANNTLRISGRIDLTNIVQVDAQTKALLVGMHSVRIDLSGVESADSSSLAMLIDCIRSARIMHQDISFCNMPRFMLDLGRVCGLDTILPVNKPLHFSS